MTGADRPSGTSPSGTGPSGGGRRDSWYWWLLICAVRYVPTFAVGWTVASAVAPRATGYEGRVLSFGESFLVFMRELPGFLAGIGGVTLFLLLLIARLRKGDPLQFRFTASMLCLLPMTIFLFFGGGLLTVAMFATQIIFTAFVMPAPGPGERKV
ncbi:hypothetical protein AB0D66_18600 [Streptomyces sp. NPDC048270]|uniref:hypothetical protein n=1 Tax=Streptomyces sp. NPDC048270 TaxID=3154615 RepID=UPI0033E98920